MRRILVYIAAFVAGLTTWFGFALFEALNPFLPWQFPPLMVLTGISFPGGATPELHYLNHVLESWFPFLVAFLVARLLTRGRARPRGAVRLYLAFLLWSLVMVLLDQFGVPLGWILGIGFGGTLIGGLPLYLRLVDPKRV
ncbi:hypothetical protein ACMA5I_03510 [Paracoccaceae bacterium GXU_MW_L88]